MYPIIKGPWKTLGTEIKYKNPWITVNEDKVIRPDGKEGIFGIVSMVSGASIIPIDDEGNVYLTGEYRYAIERETIEAPGGARDENESYAETAKRELKEELGIIAEEIIELGFIDPFTSVVNSPNYLFLAKSLTFEEKNPEAVEVLHTIKMPFTQAVKMAMNSEITHAGTVSAILKAYIYLNDNMFKKD